MNYSIPNLIFKLTCFVRINICNVKVQNNKEAEQYTQIETLR